MKQVKTIRQDIVASIQCIFIEQEASQLALDHWPRGGPDLAGVGKEDWAKAGPGLLLLTWPRVGPDIVRGRCHHWPRPGPELACLGKPPPLGQAWLRTGPAWKTLARPGLMVWSGVG
jgi:hypothetical protein